MNKQLTSLLTLLALSGSGCAFNRTTETSFNPDTQATDTTTYVGISWFNRTAVEGLTVGKRTEKTSTTLSLSKGATETQGEAIQAVGEALGVGIAAGVKKTLLP